MQRVLEAAGAAPSTCVACHTALADVRCGHCGAAARVGPWRVLRVLARSQHGAMYLAEDEAGARVALKELVFSLVPSTQELDAFTREAELLRALVHPRIPRFLASFTVGQGVSTRLYLAQQYLPGVSLTQRLAEEHFDEASVLDLARQALRVLHYLHSRSPVVVHRDVKPDNFILAADGALSLVDFGAARALKAAGTHRATLVGTFGYMAPEQLGGTVDARSDLYGLGATLVHLLTRTPPERLLGPGMTLDFQQHVNVTVKTERFLSRLVATQPDQRFASAQQALDFLEGRPVPSSRAITPRWRRALAIAAGCALLAGGLTSSVLSRLPAPLTQKPVAPATAIPLDLVVPTQPLPPPGTVTFEWIQAKWDFGKPGHWVLDQSGRGHHALLPTSGYSSAFFGLEWDGTTGLTTADSADFAPTGPFTISIGLQLKDEPLQKTVTLISRGDPEGKFAWAVQLVPSGASRKLRFSLADEAGQVSTVEGLMPRNADHWSWYVSFDPKTGEQKISMNCVTLGKKITTVRPAQELPVGAKLQLITGLRGIVHQIELMRGLMSASSAPNCSYSGERLGEE